MQRRGPASRYRYVACGVEQGGGLQQRKGALHVALLSGIVWRGTLGSGGARELDGKGRHKVHQHAFALVRRAPPAAVPPQEAAGTRVAAA